MPKLISPCVHKCSFIKIYNTNITNFESLFSRFYNKTNNKYKDKNSCNLGKETFKAKSLNFTSSPMNAH